LPCPCRDRRPPQPPARPALRRDGQRNRGAIVAAPRQLVCDHGLEAPLEQIARRAGASGRQIRWNAVDIYRITDGRISEEWAADDAADIMYQLGAFKPPWLG
jgi:predicted ester cyclase